MSYNDALWKNKDSNAMRIVASRDKKQLSEIFELHVADR